MKRALLLTLEYPPHVGGVANYYKNLVVHLPMGTVQVLDNSQSRLISELRWVWPKWIIGLWNTIRAVREYNIQHILVGQLLPLGTIALCMKLFFRIPYTVMTHAMDVTTPFGQKGNSRKRWLVKRILAHADSITTVSIYTRLYLQDLGVPPKKITMVYPCSNIQNIAETLAQEEYFPGKRILLSVCRLVERKGIDAAIEAFARIQSQYADIEYVIIGDGPDRNRLEQRVHELGVQERIHFLGRVDDNELAQWYKRCEVFIMPSREIRETRDVEGFGIVYIEANSFGKPVIAGKSGGVMDAVIDGETGLLVDPEDVFMIEKALHRLFTDVDFARQLGEHGKKRVEQLFQWEIQANELAHLLR